MSNKIILKRSSVAGRIPTTSDLDVGEIAINMADSKLYFKDTNNTVKSIGYNSNIDCGSSITSYSVSDILIDGGNSNGN